MADRYSVQERFNPHRWVVYDEKTGGIAKGTRGAGGKPTDGYKSGTEARRIANNKNRNARADDA